MHILGFPDSEQQSAALARCLDGSATTIDVHTFPDGESKLRLPPELPAQVVFCRSLDHPNSKLTELMLAAETARQLGARRLTLVAPYLCYMRQDVAFHAGEAVSQRIVGRFLAGLFERVITVDPHLHRVKSLQEAVPAAQAVALSAAPAMGEFLHSRQGAPLLVGPDRESEQWVQQAASVAGLEYVVAEKDRFGDREVTIRLPAADYAGREAVLIDDMASTGHTLAAAARELKQRGSAKVDVLVTHALFVGDALDLLRSAGVDDVYSSDSVAHPSNAFPLAPLLAAELRV